ncbi:MAG TPA: (d)CMP kinase [Spirochaetota bacterium]|nr:(d)CMP kinase [Spirochaetota bacterium]HPC40961.1 (d)CMP kinase [Spirochaetota bacterium]HPL18433.1 (d)CMP kinase [Spirochaetota bacterium]HQF08609.1 (d)CMP kinase [Spirochaetota bacterium]HQH97324.1 (d)CMP kinase [Spirochaetota bacterium]
MMKKIVVAVDGPAGSGKSSVSRQAAVGLGLKYIDSGALYRSITWYVLGRDGAVDEHFAFTPDIAAIAIRQDFLPDGTSLTFVNGTDVTTMIRDEVIARNIGIISDNRGVRNHINAMLRDWARHDSIIMDGRDIGSVVFPDADLKIYLDASVEVRAERRIKEYREMGKKVDENLIKKQIIQRDEQDSRRPYGALVRARDAVYIDTSNMPMAHVVDRIKELVLQIR